MTKVLTPLHCKINVGSQMLELGYHQNARHAFPDNTPFRGIGKSQDQKDAIEISTKGFQKKAIEGPMRLPIGKMTSKGSCNNGPLFDEFFHPKNREHSLSLYTFDTDIERVQFADIFQRLHVILSVINSRDLVRVDEFRRYCTVTHIRLNRLFRWMKDNETMHSLLGKEYIERRNGDPF